MCLPGFEPARIVFNSGIFILLKRADTQVCPYYYKNNSFPRIQ